MHAFSLCSTIERAVSLHKNAFSSSLSTVLNLCFHASSRTVLDHGPFSYSLRRSCGRSSGGPSSPLPIAVTVNRHGMPQSRPQPVCTQPSNLCVMNVVELPCVWLRLSRSRLLGPEPVSHVAFIRTGYAIRQAECNSLPCCLTHVSATCKTAPRPLQPHFPVRVPANEQESATAATAPLPWQTGHQPGSPYTETREAETAAAPLWEKPLEQCGQPKGFSLLWKRWWVTRSLCRM